jgi:hypothetical protein
MRLSGQVGPQQPEAILALETAIPGKVFLFLSGFDLYKA